MENALGVFSILFLGNLLVPFVKLREGIAEMG